MSDDYDDWPGGRRPTNLDDLLTVLNNIEDRLISIDNQLTDITTSAATREYYQRETNSTLSGFSTALSFLVFVLLIWVIINEAWPWLVGLIG